ncbi:MAG: TonB-dependent receptor [Alphaproteobacteria bacterium]|nr:TonB-dependent receptor [Alphaproteobacteria bacterium]
MRLRILGFLIVVAAGVGDSAMALGDAIPEIRVTARRLPPAASDPILARARFDRSDLARAPGLRLDDVLRTLPGFGLFRRQSSRSAHPTTQGVTLRGLGASGAGRTLVLLDGIPQNDPFGGWIDWSRMPSSSIGNATIVKGGGAGPWGNAALAGVVSLESRAREAGSGVIEARGGQRGTFEGLAAAAFKLGNATLDIDGHGHTTDGAYLIRAYQRGTVDRRAGNKGGGASASVAFEAGDVDGLARASYSEDRLTNGIAEARSRGRVGDVSLGLVNDQGDGNGWEAHAYTRDQDFRAVFVAVNATRTGATLSLDQFDVPAQAAGGNVIVRRSLAPTLSLEAGGDARFVTGATNERFQNLGAGFARLRKAGGDQTVLGAFAALTWTPNPDVILTGSARADRWRQADGVRRETVIATGAIARQDRFAPKDGVVGSARLGARVRLNETSAVRGIVYSGFRVPTLNELYRPFRVGNDITEANPALTPERLWGADAAVEWAPTEHIQFELVYFRSYLKDSVVNITLRSTPGLEPSTGVVVPAGGVVRQRRNVPRAVSDGIEAEAKFAIGRNLDLTARYLFADPNIRRSPDQPALVGARLAQIPRHQVSIGLDAQLADRLDARLQFRSVSSQFDDDLNQRRLAAATVVDARFGFGMTEAIGLYIAAENLFDREIEAGRAADGLASVGTPRTVTAGVSLNF